MPFVEFGGKAKGRIPKEDIDYYLDGLDLYRKRVPRDGNSLFRCVSEQLFMTQAYHNRLRQAVCRYMERHRDEFEQKCKKTPFNEHLATMVNDGAEAGFLEMKVLSELYRCDILLYRDAGRGPMNVTRNNYVTTVLVYMVPDPRHFDFVVPKTRLSLSGLCQGIVYGNLYGKSFGLGKSVDIFVHLMLNNAVDPHMNAPIDSQLAAALGIANNRALDADPTLQSIYGQRSKSFSSSGAHAGQSDMMYRARDDGDLEGRKKSGYDCMKNEQPLDDIRTVLQELGPPFPYKVAKSIATFVYRNVDHDVWMERIKEERRRGSLSLRCADNFDTQRRFANAPVYNPAFSNTSDSAYGSSASDYMNYRDTNTNRQKPDSPSSYWRDNNSRHNNNPNRPNNDWNSSGLYSPPFNQLGQYNSSASNFQHFFPTSTSNFFQLSPPPSNLMRQGNSNAGVPPFPSPMGGFFNHSPPPPLTPMIGPAPIWNSFSPPPSIQRGNCSTPTGFMQQQSPNEVHNASNNANLIQHHHSSNFAQQQIDRENNSAQNNSISGRNKSIFDSSPPPIATAPIVPAPWNPNLSPPMRQQQQNRMAKLSQDSKTGLSPPNSATQMPNVNRYVSPHNRMGFSFSPTPPPSMKQMTFGNAAKNPYQQRVDMFGTHDEQQLNSDAN